MTYNPYRCLNHPDTPASEMLTMKDDWGNYIMCAPAITPLCGRCGLEAASILHKEGTRDMAVLPNPYTARSNA